MLSLVGATFPALAQSPDLMAAYRQYKALKAQGKYAEAEPFARKALELGKDEFGPNHQSCATLLNNLAELYRAQGRYGEAEPLYKRSLAIDEITLSPDHPDVATSLNNLAGLYDNQGRLDLALETIRRASAIHRARAARTGGGRGAGGLSEQRKVRYSGLTQTNQPPAIPRRFN